MAHSCSSRVGVGPNWAVLNLPPRHISGPIQREICASSLGTLAGQQLQALVSVPLLPASSVPAPGYRHPSSTLGTQLAEHPGASLPALHHPAADGFSQALRAHLISPRPRSSSVTFLRVYMLIKATSEATGHLLCCIAELRSLTTAQTSLH